MQESKTLPNFAALKATKNIINTIINRVTITHKTQIIMARTKKNNKSENANNVATISKSAVNASAKGIAKNNNRDKKDIKNDRLTLRATLREIANGEKESHARFREFLNLPKNAKNADRERVYNWLNANWENVAEVTYYTTFDAWDAYDGKAEIVPCRANGKLYKDYLDAIADLKISLESRRTKIAAVSEHFRNAAKVAKSVSIERFKIRQPDIIFNIRRAFAINGLFKKERKAYHVCVEIGKK